MKYILLISAIVVSSCSANRKLSKTDTYPADNFTVGGKIFSSLYQQKAAEYRALCYQAYNIASMRIAQYKSQTLLPKAIITDIDETILDNSPYAVHQALQGKDYDQLSWYQWTSKGKADTMPGAATFLNQMFKSGIEIFYITNRYENERQGTLKNLQQYNLPGADNSHLIMRQSTSSKEARRRTVMATHEVVLLMGDNLADFSELFDKKTVADRGVNTDKLASEFGSKFIVFPNPNYGDWENSLFNYQYNLTNPQKDSIYRQILRSY